MKFTTNMLTILSAWRFRSLGTLLNSVLWTFGILWLALEITDFFARDEVSTGIKPYWWIFLLVGISVGIVRAWPRTSVAARIENTDVMIEIKVEDMFKLPGAMVIATNTTFDTSIEAGPISPRSTQGQFTNKYFAKSVSRLDSHLLDSLTELRCEELNKIENPYGKRYRYDVGTVAMIQCENRNAYFLATATLNEHRVATGSLQNILDALPQLWEHIRSRGDIEPICIPIIGSGFSRAEAPRDRLAQEIIRSFIAASNEKKFCEKLTIAVAPEDFCDRKVDLERLGQFLKHACRYTSAFVPAETKQAIGTPARVSSDPIRFLKATRFLLDEHRDKRDYRSFCEAMHGSLEQAVPILLKSATFDDFIKNSNAELQIGDLPRGETPPMDLIAMTWRVLDLDRGSLRAGPDHIAGWGVFTNKRAIMDQTAKQHFDKMHLQFRMETMA